MHGLRVFVVEGGLNHATVEQQAFDGFFAKVAASVRRCAIDEKAIGLDVNGCNGSSLDSRASRELL